MNMTNPGGNPTHEYKHGTTTVAVKYKDGVVIGADRRASMGYLVASPTVKKVLPLDDRTVFTIAGLPSDAIYLYKLLKAEMGLYRLNRGRKMNSHALTNLFSTIMHGQFRTGFPYFVGIIIAAVDEKGPHVYNFDGSGSISDDPYTSTGSGSPYAYGTLETMWKDDMTEEEAVNAVALSVRSGVLRDIATGDGMTMFVIDKKKGMRELTMEEIKTVLGDKYPFVK